MSFKSILKLQSPLFDTSKIRAAASMAVGKTAKQFKNYTRQKMIKSSPSGKLYEKTARGAGTRRFHRASARGQRPAPDTMTLVNAVSDRKTGEFSAEVFIADKINPENGANARDYAGRLQNKMNRPIMQEADARIHGSLLELELEKAIKNLI